MKEKIKYLGKCLLLEKNNEKVLVIGDLHLGYEEVMRSSGVLVPSGIYDQVIEDMKLIFDEIGKEVIDKIILLGDLRHEFGKILRSEWKEVLDFIDYLRTNLKKGGEIVVLKGNHDTMTEFILNKKDIEIVDYFLWENFAFLHGDRDFGEIIRNDKLKYWIMGHVHPAITINDEKSAKKEKFKCFLKGKFKGKEIILVPSFFPVVEGSDIKNSKEDFGLAWNFKLNDFEVLVVEGENSLEVLNFGKLSKIN